MASKPTVPGIRFHPTDEELFMYYLKRKVTGRPHQQIMAEVDVYKFAPWDLPAMSCLKTRDLNWYFFCPRARKFSSGSRANRATEYGYWKSTGNDRSVEYQGRVVGKIKTLVFYRGKPPKGERTDWIMYEYRLEDQLLANQGVSQDSFVICKIYEKSGLGPKNGEHYGAPFVEEEWESDDDNNVKATDPNPSPDPESVVQHEDVSMAYSAEMSPYYSMGPGTSTAVSDSVAMVTYAGEKEQQTAATEPEEDELDRMLAVFYADKDASPTDACPTDALLTDGMIKEKNKEDDCFDGLEDLQQPPQSTYGNYSWSQMLAIIDYAKQNNLYIEVDDFLL